jgi:hypothetical protein
VNSGNWLVVRKGGKRGRGRDCTLGRGNYEIWVLWARDGPGGLFYCLNKREILCF